MQKILAALQFAGILFLILKGMFTTPSAIPVAAPVLNNDAHPTFGLALVFVLLTFGGWNEAAYISAELKSGSKKMSFLLISSILIITCIYLLLNWSFLKVLGLEGVASSKALGIDFMRATTTGGEAGIIFIGILISLAALTSLNTTMFTGARSSYALGNDVRVFAFLGKWHGKKSTPVNALFVQCIITALLIFFGVFTRDGFEAMVDFTAPVFWFFFLCCGISVIVLRMKEPNRERPFKVPLYPLTPLVFIGCSAYLLYSSLKYTGTGALIGVALLAIGLILLLRLKKKDREPQTLKNVQMKKRVLCLSLLILLGFSIHSFGQKEGLDVPYVPTPQAVVEAMLDLGKVNKNDVLHDLGCGDGRIVITAAKKYGAIGTGVDLDPERIKEANANAKKEGVTGKVKFVNGNLFNFDFSKASVLTLYLLPKVNKQLKSKILSEMKPGDRVVSHTFDMGDWVSNKKIEVEGKTLYLWIVPEKNKRRTDLRNS